MEWQQIEHFHTVAKLQHVTRAAEKLAITQPALSRSIANLEAELGVPLFDRQGRTVRLNRYGERFAIHVDRVLKEMEDGKEELRHLLDPDSGTVAIAFLKSLGLSAVPSLLNEFLREAPNIQFQLSQHSTHAMLDQLERGEVDFVLSSMTESRHSIEWDYLWKEEIYAYVPKGHKLADQPELDIRDMKSEAFIALKRGYGLRTIADQLFEQAGIEPHIVLEGEEVITVLGFVSAGFGISFLPDIPNVKPDNIVQIPFAAPGCSRRIGLAWRANGYLPPPAERFRAFLLKRFLK